MNENQYSINDEIVDVFWNVFYKNGDSLKLVENSESGYPRFIGFTYGDQRWFEKEWNEDGFSLYFIDESGCGLADWLWNNNGELTNDFLKENYPARKIHLIADTDKPPIIEFKLIDIPISDLLDMDDQDIAYYGESISDLEYEYHMIFEDVMDQFNFEQSGAIMRSPEDTREYLSDKSILMPLFDEIREHLRFTLRYSDLSDDEHAYLCMRNRDCGYGIDNYFNNFKRICRKHNLDWQVTLKALDDMTNQDFFCECKIYNLFGVFRTIMLRKPEEN